MKAGFVNENGLWLSGTMAYGAVQSGLSMPASTITATEIAGGAVTSAKILSGNVLAVHISGQQVTSVKQAFVGTGSPTAYGNTIQFGKNTSTAGSVLDVVFGTAFKAAPNVVVSEADASALSSVVLVAGSIATTGFTALTTGGSKDVHWVACGSL